MFYKSHEIYIKWAKLQINKINNLLGTYFRSYIAIVTRNKRNKT